MVLFVVFLCAAVIFTAWDADATVISVSNETYYSVTVLSDDLYLARSAVPGSLKVATLEDKYLTAKTILLSFSFYFYGNSLDQVTVTSGGFLYMSDFLHQWLSASQYVAPLMANFDTRGNDSDVWYADTGDELFVWWENLYLADDTEVGPFTFQVKVNKSGHIIFSYKEISKAVDLISTAEHPVKVGVADAYYQDELIDGTNSTSRRTILEYHKISVDFGEVKVGQSIVLQPFPTCNMLLSCEACTSTVVTGFDCKYCAAIDHCADGPDRMYQDWKENDCDEKAIKRKNYCDSTYTTTKSPWVDLLSTFPVPSTAADVMKNTFLLTLMTFFILI